MPASLLGVDRLHNERSHLEFLGLREQPFAPTADPIYFYSTREHKSCLYRLWSSIDERHGIAVVLGNYGTGKTTLLRKLITGMASDPSRYNTAVVGSPIPSWTSFSLLEAIVHQFGLRPSSRSFGAYMESLNQFLMANHHKVSTLIIDDAQNLNKRGQLELLRLVQNLETPQHKLLNLVLFAQLEWMHVLKAAPNFEQRINLTYTLAPLRPDEVRDFITFRIQQAGGGPNAPEFSDLAIRMIHAYSEGNPRVIVTLCRNALLFAGQIETNQLNEDVVLYTIEKTTVPDDDRRARAKAVLTRPLAGKRRASAPIQKVQFRNEGPRRTARTRDEQANELLLRAARGKTRRTA